MPNRQSFRLTAGEDRTLTFTALDNTGTPINLTGASIDWRVSRLKGNAPSLIKTGTVLSAANGTFTVSVSAGDTNLLRAGTYFHQGIVTISGSTTNGVEGNLVLTAENQSVLDGSVGAVFNNNQFYGSRAEAILTKLGTNASFIETFGYYTVGDGGGGKYKRVGSAPSHIGYFQSADGAYWEIIPDTEIDIKQFGAKGDGGTDDTVAINGAFDYLRAQVIETNETDPSYFIRIPYGKFRTTGPINATGIRNQVWGIKGYGGEIYADFNGGNVIDMIFSRFPRCEDFSIVTASGKTPNIGILVGRETTNHFVSDDHEWQNVHVEGTFSLAAKFNYGSEDCASYNCMYINNSSSTSAYCGAYDGSNHLGATSTFQTLGSDSATSFNSVIHRDTNWRRPNGGPCLYLSKTDGHDFDDCFLATSSGPAVVLYTTAALFNRNLKFKNTHIETTGMTACFRFDGDASQTVVGFEYDDFNPFCSDEIFLAGAGVTSVTLVYPKIKVTGILNGVNPTNGVFSPASTFKFKKPDIRVYNNGASVLELWDGITLASAYPNASHTGDTAEATLATVSIYANIIGANGCLEVDTFWQFGASGNAKTMRARLGTVGNGLTGDIWLATTDSSGAAQSLHDRRMIANANATGAQTGVNGAATGGWGTTNQAAAVGSIDTTGATDLVFTAQCANSGDTITLKRYTVKLHLP